MRAIVIHNEDEEFEKIIVDKIEELIAKIDKDGNSEVNYFITE